jgi:hypothetical protein
MPPKEGARDSREGVGWAGWGPAPAGTPAARIAAPTIP